MQKKYTIAVLGGTGKSGIYLVRRLLSEGYPIRLLHRNPPVIQNPNPEMEWVQGDARQPESLYQLINGCGAVISTLGQPRAERTIFSDATGNIIRAMNSLNIRRYIVTTGVSVDTPLDKKGAYASAATAWMKTNYPETTMDKQREWEMLFDSGLDWTLVRLPLIELTEKNTQMQISLSDCPGEKISAGTLAGFLIGQLEDKTYFRQSPFIADA